MNVPELIAGLAERIAKENCYDDSETELDVITESGLGELLAAGEAMKEELWHYEGSGQVQFPTYEAWDTAKAKIEAYTRGEMP